MLIFTPYGKREILLATFISGVLVVIIFFLTKKLNLPWLKYLYVLPGGLIAFTLFFFRDPPRKISYKPCEILSPCDGFITHIDTAFEPYYFKKKMKRISIFMSALDVHVQRASMPGKVVFVKHNPGAFINAQREESLEKNENNIIVIETDYGFPILIKQIAGVFARRIVCKLKVGDRVKAGEKIGMVKFGSRGEVYLPLNLDIEVFVKKGQHVKGGLTVLGRVRGCR